MDELAKLCHEMDTNDQLLQGNNQGCKYSLT